MPGGTRPKVWLHRNAVLLSAQAEKYSRTPSDLVTLRRAAPGDAVLLDQAVMLWAQAEALMDQVHERKFAQ